MTTPESSRLDAETMDKALGRKIDAKTGMVSLNPISQNLTTTLHALSTANPAIEKMEYAADVKGDAFNPTPIAERGDHWFHFAEVKPSDLVDELKAIAEFIPGLSSVSNLTFQFLKCDYMGMHNDTNLMDLFHNGAIVMLLDAPLGCTLITNNEHKTNLTPGDVVLIDDHLEHGVYPIQRPAKADRQALLNNGAETLESTAFTKANCMSFLLICRMMTAESDDQEYKISA
jgi:hypothetical protein